MSQPEHYTVQGRAAAALVRAATAPSGFDLQIGTPEELVFLQRVGRRLQQCSPVLQHWSLTAAHSHLQEAPNLEEWAVDLDNLDFAEPETGDGCNRGSGGDDAGQLRGSQQNSHTAEGSYERRRSAGGFHLIDVRLACRFSGRTDLVAV